MPGHSTQTKHALAPVLRCCARRLCPAAALPPLPPLLLLLLLAGATFFASPPAFTMAFLVIGRCFGIGDLTLQLADAAWVRRPCKPLQALAAAPWLPLLPGQNGGRRSFLSVTVRLLPGVCGQAAVLPPNLMELLREKAFAIFDAPDTTNIRTQTAAAFSSGFNVRDSPFCPVLPRPAPCGPCARPPPPP